MSNIKVSIFEDDQHAFHVKASSTVSMNLEVDGLDMGAIHLMRSPKDDDEHSYRLVFVPTDKSIEPVECTEYRFDSEGVINAKEYPLESEGTRTVLPA